MEYHRYGGGVWGPYHTVAMVFGPGVGVVFPTVLLNLIPLHGSDDFITLLSR